MDTDASTYAIFTTDNGCTNFLQYVAEGEDEEEAFSAFDDDILSDTGEEEGWDWHVYEIPSDLIEDIDVIDRADEDAIYDHVSDRSPTTITS